MSMKFNPDIHHRRSIRLKHYDYSKPGVYFITVCTQNRECLFGEIVCGEIKLNGSGRMVKTVWDRLPDYYLCVQTDEFIVMPNHIHGVIVLTDVGAGPRACPDEYNKEGHPRRGAPTVSLGDVMYGFKSMTTTLYRQGVEIDGWPPFNKRLWQRNYYERIIRDENEMNRIRKYIQDNPINWELDEENPEGKP